MMEDILDETVGKQSFFRKKYLTEPPRNQLIEQLLICMVNVKVKLNFISKSPIQLKSHTSSIPKNVNKASI